MLDEGPASLQCLRQLHLQQRAGSQTLAAWIAGELTRQQVPPDLPPPPPHTTARTVWKERDPLPLCLAAQHQHATEPHFAPAGGGEMFSGPGSRIAKQGQKGVNLEVRGTPWILTHRIFLLPAPGLMKHGESHTHTQTHTHTHRVSLAKTEAAAVTPRPGHCQGSAPTLPALETTKPLHL